MSRFPEKLRIDLTNRLHPTHCSLVNRIVYRDFTLQEATIHHAIVDLSQAIIDTKLAHQTTSFIFHNDDQDWQTHLMLREKEYSSNQLGLSFIKMAPGHKHKAVQNEVSARMLKERVKKLLGDTKYCNGQYRERLHNFILQMSEELEDTHHFAISIIKNRRAVQVSMRDRLGRSMAHFYVRDLLNIEQEQLLIFRTLSGYNSKLHAAVHH